MIDPLRADRRTRAPLPLLAFACGVLASCGGASATASDDSTTAASAPRAALDPRVEREFARHDIRPSSAAREFTETLPTDLMSTASWGTKIGPCRAGGYDLGAAAGHTVRMLRYAIDDRVRGERLYAWAILDGDDVVCVFRSVREDSEMAPGVFAASGD